MKKTWIICLLLIIAFLPSAFAQTPEITNGLTYLNTTQNIDGSWGDDTSLMEKLPSTVTVIETLRILNRSDTTNYADAVLWLQGYIVKTADYISERITVLPTTEGEDLKNILAYLDATAYAWGGYKDFKVNILDTALALRALKAVDYQDGELIGSALNYLTSTQNHDGGWGFCSSSQGGCQNGAESGVYMTALVSSTLRQFDITPDIATAINGATKYLTAHQNLDGGFGFDALSGEARSTIYETALAYMALMGVTTDATVLRGAVDHLKATQSEDGSWLQDPYATALAVRALHYSEDLPPVPPELTSGTITGEVTDATRRSERGRTQPGDSHLPQSLRGLKLSGSV